MTFDGLSDDELAARLAEELGVAPDTALYSIRSDDPDLGRAFAIGVLEARSQHRADQEQLTSLRRSIRSA